MSDYRDETAYNADYQKPMPGEGRPQSNVLGVVGFILAFCVSPLGLLLSLIALRKPPRGLAIGGVVVGLLGTAVWGVFIAGGVMFGKYAMNAVEGVADYQAIRTAMTTYHQSNDAYPTSLDALSSLTADEKNDPWGTPYKLVVKADGSGWELVSAGIDMTFDTPDDITLAGDLTEQEVGNRIGESIQRHFENKQGKP